MLRRRPKPNSAKAVAINGNAAGTGTSDGTVKFKGAPAMPLIVPLKRPKLLPAPVSKLILNKKVSSVPPSKLTAA